MRSMSKILARMLGGHEGERLKFVREDCYFGIYDFYDKEKAHIHFHIDKDKFGHIFTFLEDVESYCPGEGFFGILFDKFLDISRGKNSEYFLLRVASNNNHAISIYKHLGFYFIEETNERSRFLCMRKDLLSSK